MTTLVIREIDDNDIDAVIDLWQGSGLTRSWNDPYTDIAFAREAANATILVAIADEKTVASAMVGHDGHRGAVYYVCVAPERRNEGLGRAIMDAAELWLRNRGVWKLNLMVRAENREVVEFYTSLGYSVEERVTMAKQLGP